MAFSQKDNLKLGYNPFITGTFCRIDVSHYLFSIYKNIHLFNQLYYRTSPVGLHCVISIFFQDGYFHGHEKCHFTITLNGNQLYYSGFFSKLLMGEGLFVFFFFFLSPSVPVGDEVRWDGRGDLEKKLPAEAPIPPKLNLSNFCAF